MAGLGRRTHYRKHLTDSVLFDLVEPEKDERIAKVVGTRGSNQFDILLARPSSHDDGTPPSDSRSSQLAILPTKFRKLVWVKRNDYVIVQTGIEEEEEDQDADVGGAASSTADDHVKPTDKATSASSDTTGSIRYIITHILYKDQVNHLRSKGLWPDHDPQFVTDGQTPDNESDQVGSDEEDGDGIDYDAGFQNVEDEELFVNTNRVAALAIQDSSSEEDDSDDD